MEPGAGTAPHLQLIHGMVKGVRLFFHILLLLLCLSVGGAQVGEDTVYDEMLHLPDPPEPVQVFASLSQPVHTGVDAHMDMERPAEGV